MAPKSSPTYFMSGEILKIGGLSRILGCTPLTARRIAEGANGFPPKRIWGRGIEGWSRKEVLNYLENPTALEVVNEKSQEGERHG